MDLRKNMLLHLHAQRVNADRVSVIPQGISHEEPATPPATPAKRSKLSSYRSPSGPYRGSPQSDSPNSISSPEDSPLSETDSRHAADEELQERARQLFILSLREKLAARFAKSKQRRLGIKPIRHLKYDEARVNETRQLMDDLQYLHDTAENERAAQHWLRLQENRQLEDDRLREREETKHKVARLTDYAERKFSSSPAKPSAESPDKAKAIADQDLVVSEEC
ncbi:hypothetical protein GQ53DRAFT_750659 [Thozetella sp. PMI_491]|nr:hypothetical protein GQ53DRAFT_750659 [Thozetella sp. PMI_491]